MIVDLKERPRHFFGSTEQRIKSPLVYPFFSDTLDPPAVVLLRFRVSRIDNATTLIANQKTLCKELFSNASNGPEQAGLFLYSLNRLMLLVQESVKRAQMLEEGFLEREEFSKFVPDIAAVLRDSSLTAKNQIRYVTESLYKAREFKLPREGLELSDSLKQNNQMLDQNVKQCGGYLFAEHFFRNQENIKTPESV